MFNRTTKNDDIDVNQDVNDLADSLEALLKSYGSEAKDEVDSARSQAQALLKQTRAKLHDKPWHGVGIGAAVGLVLGALLVGRR